MSSLLIKPATYQSGVICFFLHLSLPLWGQFLILTWIPQGFKQLLNQSGDWRNESWERGIFAGNLRMVIPLSLWRSGPCVRCVWASVWQHLIEKLYIGYSSKKRKITGWHRELPSTVDSPLSHWCQLEADTRGRMLEEPRLETDMRVSTTVSRQDAKTG